MLSRERRNLEARESYRKRMAAETPSQTERRKQANHEAYQQRKSKETPSQAERRKATVREAYKKRKERSLHGGTERNEARRAANTQLQQIRRANETVEITNNNGAQLSLT